MPQPPPLVSFAALQAKGRHQWRAPGTSPGHTVSCWPGSLSLLCFGSRCYFKTFPHNLPHDGNGLEGKSLLPIPCPTLVLLWFFILGLFGVFSFFFFLEVLFVCLFVCLFLNGSIPTCWPSCQGNICMQFKPFPHFLAGGMSPHLTL